MRRFNLLDIENYQSLRQLRLELGRFTVITGPTGSGKSAVIRAARMLAFNARGTTYITRGEKACRVLVFDDRSRQGLALARGGRGADGYALNLDGTEQVFTKLAGQVPEQVAEWHGLTQLNFAGQFDKPFLLTESGAEVARILGQLTNVTMLLSAAREANRRRLRLADALREKEETIAGLHAELQQYATLPARRAALQQAEEAFARHEAITMRADRLRALLEAYSRAEAVQAALPVQVNVPGVSELAAQVARIGRLGGLLAALAQARQWADQVTRVAAEQETARQQAEAGIHRLLADAGVCPLCGQTTRSMSDDGTR